MNYTKIDYELSYWLKINRIHYTLKPPTKGSSETLNRCFTSKTGILSMKLCYKVYLH